MSDSRDMRSVSISTRAVVVALAASLALAGVPAGAAPATPAFGPLIEGLQPYQGQSACKPKAKPGVKRFAKLLEAAYGDSWFGISRGCEVGGKSEHKEGRALDWAMDATDPADRAKVDDLFAWLSAADAYGNEQAVARRIGLMYVIWDRQMWSSWTGGWEVICVQKQGRCVDPDDGHEVHPHRDHVHFTFSWQGARRRTSFFQPDRSWMAGIATSGSGYLLLGGDGSVTETSPYQQSVGPAPGREAVTGIAATPSGAGYWRVTRRGQVLTSGDAPFLGRVTRKKGKLVDVEGTASGSGYWLVGKGGRIDAFGDATNHGGGKGAKIVGMARTPSGQGYLLFSRTGAVLAFGDAAVAGDLSGTTDPVVAGAVHPGGGYWLLTEGGHVAAFGGAPALGDAPGVAPAMGIAASESGNGYWVAGRSGAVQLVGAA